MKTKKRKNKPLEVKSHEYFQGHPCHMTPQQLGYEIHCSIVRKYILSLVTVWAWDIRAQNLYRSYSALMSEKYRQYKNYAFSIHPFSRLRFFMDTLLIFTTLTTFILIPIQHGESSDVRYDIFRKIINTFDCIYIVNIVMNLFTGYVEGNTAIHVVLDLKYIIWRYIKTCFIFDLISVADVFVDAENMYIHVCLVVIKMQRCYILYKHIQKFLLLLGAGVTTKTIFELTFFLSTYISWNMYFQLEVVFLLTTAISRPTVQTYMSHSILWNQTLTTRYVYSLNEAVRMLRQNSNVYVLRRPKVEYFYITAWIISKLIIFHCAFKYIINMFGIESARAKYFMMMQQVETYIGQRRFPPRIKKKILKFYAIRFHSNFFLESNMLACVSGQLREDIIMHTGRQLVSEVEFLKQLPRGLLLQIGLKLKIVIFIAGDIIFKINTIGDCLYFIDKGTVAIYSESGKEICHLEDGDFFGEIALVMKHRIRTATVVAVSNCELYRLSRKDFNNSVACYPTVYENIKKVAMNRFERTSVMDEHHKTELSTATEVRGHN